MLESDEERKEKVLLAPHKTDRGGVSASVFSLHRRKDLTVDRDRREKRPWERGKLEQPWGGKKSSGTRKKKIQLKELIGGGRQGGESKNNSVSDRHRITLPSREGDKSRRLKRREEETIKNIQKKNILKGKK